MNEYHFWPKKGANLKDLKILGLLISFALVLDCSMNLDFPEIFYEMLLKNVRRRKRKKFSLEDLQEIEPEI